MELTTSHKHIKNTPVEQFSQKTNWKLAEDLLYSCKKDLHVTR